MRSPGASVARLTRSRTGEEKLVSEIYGVDVRTAGLRAPMGRAGVAVLESSTLERRGWAIRTRAWLSQKMSLATADGSKLPPFEYRSFPRRLEKRFCDSH